MPRTPTDTRTPRATAADRRALDAAIARSWMLRSPLGELDPTAADALVIDLEDGLPAARKAEGRAIAAAFLRASAAWLRISAHGTPEWEADAAVAAVAPGLRGVMLAVTESAAQIEATAQRLPAGTPVIALIESAIGLERAMSIASHPSTFRLAFGTGDFRRDTGMADDPVVLSWPRARLVVASAAAGIAAPIDGPTLGDADTARAASRHALDMGMTGKLVLRDDHVAAVEAGLSPDPDAIAHAVALLQSAQQGSTAQSDDAVDGSYAPALARAERLLDRAAAFGLVPVR